jgi:hypothetical protein
MTPSVFIQPFTKAKIQIYNSQNFGIFEPFLQDPKT